MSPQRGTTVAELVVTLGLVTVVILAAAQLIGAATRVSHGARDTTSSPGEIALTALLRRDVQAASGSVLQPTSWDQRPLELVTWAGARVRYVLVDGELSRETLDATGARSGRRVVATGVGSWWWRLATPRAVEVRVSLVTVPRHGSGTAPVGHRTVRRVFAFRGWPDGRSW